MTCQTCIDSPAFVSQYGCPAEKPNALIQTILRHKGAAEFEGIQLKYIGEWSDLKPGDTYVAERNQGPRLLTVSTIKETLGDRDQFVGAVFAKESAYPYDLGECVKIEIVI